MIYVTGDTHGDVYERCERLMPFLDKGDENFLIVCGDFGLIWGINPPRYEWEEDRLKYEKKQIEKIGKLPLTVLFCDGNHEGFDRLNSEFPVVDFYGGKAHKISDNIYHLMRGEMFEIEGNKIFAFGGARSHDVWNLFDPKDPKYWDKVETADFYRTIGETWWENEIATEDEFKHGIETLKKHNWTCDYIISHEAPKSDALFLNRDGGVMCDYLELIKQSVSFKHWFFGHHHCNCPTDNNTECLYYGFEKMDMKKKHKDKTPFSQRKLTQVMKKAEQERKDVLSGKYQREMGM